MKPCARLLVAIVAAGCNRIASTPQAQTPAEAAQQAGAIKTSTDPAVNPNAAVMADFKARVEKYAELHKDLAKGSAAQKDNRTPEQIEAQKAALTAKIQTARAGAASAGSIRRPVTSWSIVTIPKTPPACRATTWRRFTKTRTAASGSGAGTAASTGSIRTRRRSAWC